MHKDALHRLTETTRAYVLAKRQYETDLRDHMRAYYDPAERDSKFWEMVDKLADGVERLPRHTSEQVCECVLWQIMHKANWSIEAWEDCVKFAAAYSELRSKLHALCFDFDGIDRGDDSYGDLVEALPLAGKDMIDTLLAGDAITNGQQLYAAIRAARPKLAHCIIYGETYMCMRLEDKLMQYFPIVARPSTGWSNEDE